MTELPCASCKAECCGPVPLGGHRLKTILAYIGTMPRKEIKRLWRQKREELTCRFLDIENNVCSIYDSRPAICSLYGRVPGLQCPKVGGLVQIITGEKAHTMLVQEGQTIMLSTSFSWKNSL